MAKKLPPGYYDPADYVLVHKDYLARLQGAQKVEPCAACAERQRRIDAAVEQAAQRRRDIELGREF